ncbi:MAG: T9SS type B sorting domain-containing protein [Bacteroidetes bacterium]|nr:MAG: T9SS type B sorting domain-containing protein [Bacteroidota bacterium]
MKIACYISTCLLFLTFYSQAQEIVHPHNEKNGFVENKGQWRKEILFQSHFNGGKWWIVQKGFLFDFQNFGPHHAHVTNEPVKEIEHTNQLVQAYFIGSNNISEIEKGKPSKHYFNYFLGNDPSKWTSEVHSYTEAQMNELYPGIDLKLIEQEQQLKYEFHVDPEVNPDQIRIRYRGQKKILLNRTGELIIETELGQLIEEKPYAYQIINGKIKSVACHFVLQENELSFELGKYDRNYKLVIDPILVFATYNGAETDNFGMTATYGYDGTAYSGGTVFGNRFPIPDSSVYDPNGNINDLHGNFGITDVFVTRYSSDGTQMLWSTYLGGGDAENGTETAHSMICDRDNNIYVYGITSSSDFPIKDGFQSNFQGGEFVSIPNNAVKCKEGTDIFVAKLSASGQQLLGSTFIGGTNNDGLNAANNDNPIQPLFKNYGDQFRGEIMLDKDRNIYVASCTYSTDFPTKNSFFQGSHGKLDGVLFKIKNDFSELLNSTYIGGNEMDACYSVKIDSSGFIVFTGGTNSNLDPLYTLGTLNPSFLGGTSDGFVGRLSPDWNSSLRMTYMGTDNYDQSYFVEIDSDDDIFLLGQSEGGNFPVTNAAYSVPGSTQFIAQLDAGLTTIKRSTVFGSGIPFDVELSPSAFLVDECGNIYVSGWGSNLTNLPVTPDAYLPTPPGDQDFYIMVINKRFDKLIYGSYMGGPESGEHVDGGTSRFDKNGIVYQSVCGGCGGLSDFPTTDGAWSNVNNSTNCNNLVFKFDFQILGKAEFVSSDTASCAPLTVTFDNVSFNDHEFSWDFGNGVTNNVDKEPSITYSEPGDYRVTLAIHDTLCPIVDTAYFDIEVLPQIQHEMSEDTLLCIKSIFQLTANSFGTATKFHWSESKNFQDTLNPDPNLGDSIVMLVANSSKMYYLKLSNPYCEAIDSVMVRVLSSEITLQTDPNACAGDSMVVFANNQSGQSITYEWFPEERIEKLINSSTVHVNTDEPGYLYANISNNLGCEYTDSIFVNISQVSSASVDALASDTIVTFGTQVTLTALPNGNYDYLWTPGGNITNPQSQQTTTIINETTTFYVQISDGACVAYDSITIFAFSNLCKPPEVYVPNAFSPNDKNRNEKFFVRGPHIEEMLLRIYDRWGQLVFETTNKHEGWDGTYKGRPLDPDVYDYYLIVRCIAGNEEIIKGNVTILK